MPKVKCPLCNVSLKVEERHIGRRVTCPKCKEKVTLAAPSSAPVVTVVDKNVPVKKSDAAVPNGNSELPADDVFASDALAAPVQPLRTSSPPRKKKPATADQPIVKKPKGKARKSSTKDSNRNTQRLLIIGASALAASVLIGGLLFYAFSGGSNDSNTVANNTNDTSNASDSDAKPDSDKKPDRQDAVGTSETQQQDDDAEQNATDPDVAAEPGTSNSSESPVANAISMPVKNAAADQPSAESRKELLDRMRSATVYIKVETTNGGQTGSGFLVNKDEHGGVVITNDHVIEPEDGQLRKIECVFYSGTNQELVLSATACGKDPALDLAALTVKGQDLPQPFSLEQETDLIETMPIMVLGFPFGEAMKTSRRNPSITISKSSISSIRRGNFGQIALVQIDGGMNPGNSGGPVVSEDGRLIGVSVSKVREADIGFAIPRRQLLEAMQGRVTTVEVETTRPPDMRVWLMDPMQNIESVSVAVIREAETKNLKLPSNGEWELISSEKIVPTIHRDTFAVARVDAEQSDWYQILVKRKDGEDDVTPPLPFKRKDQPATSPPPTRMAESRPRARPQPRPGVTSDPRGNRNEPAPTNDAERLSDNDKLVKFPSTFSDIDLAGGGKYLVFTLDKINKLAVFDVQQRKMAGFISTESGIICAATRDKICVVNPSNKTIQRWSLDSLKRENVALINSDKQIQVVAAGHASNGPILVGSGDSRSTLQMIKLSTLSELKLTGDDPRRRRFDVGADCRVRASADGTVFTAWRTRTSPSGLMSLAINGNVASSHYEHDTVGYIAPAFDGSRLYTAQGIYTPELSLVGTNKKMGATSFPVPAVTGSYYLKVMRGEERDGQRKDGLGATIGVCIDGSDNPIALINDTNLRSGAYSDFFAREDIPLDKRVYFFPEMNSLITVPIKNDTIAIRDVSVDKLLEESGVDYLFFTSSPILNAQTGKRYQYQAGAKSKHGEVEYSLQSGPKGMRVSSAGLVTWLPGRRDTGAYDVLLSISDSSGSETYQTYKVQVQ